MCTCQNKTAPNLPVDAVKRVLSFYDLEVEPTVENVEKAIKVFGRPFIEDLESESGDNFSGLGVIAFLSNIANKNKGNNSPAPSSPPPPPEPKKILGMPIPIFVGLCVIIILIVVFVLSKRD